MIFAINQNGLLNGTDDLRYWLALTRCYFIKCRMTKLIRIAYGEFLAEIRFGNMIDMRDDMHSHPGMNCTHIALFDGAILFLETPHSLNCLYRSKGQYSKYEKQCKTDKL